MGEVPGTPGVMPMLAGTVGVLGACVGSWLAVAAETTVATDSAAATGRPSSGMLGMRGSPVGLGA
ncbi:hypothetical protein [Mycobacteroides abscessus]|uniref:hypothetical protein n=1 Tax=Mycobacteroides abscessus TaxID=36809 RepID=UPI0019D283D3|nr:hypothetical protein [Mycobacteroides abscessus]MBN7315094.1 hypothetical protein [Mycobacteroides abscessus subsp. abscessus]